MAEEDARRIGQEGSRWFNAMPTGEEVADWFEKNVQVHEGLARDHYVQGITLIPNTEKSKAVIDWDANGFPVIGAVENLVFTPYAKVETRIKYFNDLMAVKGEDWLGVIEPVATPEPPKNLPPGFFGFPVNAGEARVFRYIACSMKVTVFERAKAEWKEWRNTKTGEMEGRWHGPTIIDAAPATKMVPLMGRYDPDPSSLMKAETGAIGRALGMAGMLVIPGSGVATAEDMQEALGGGKVASLPEDQDVPPVTAGPTQQSETVLRETVTDLQQQAVSIINALKDEFPHTFEEYRAWAQERGIGQVNEVGDVRILEGMIKKADRDLTNERGNAAKAAKTPEPKPQPQGEPDEKATPPGA